MYQLKRILLTVTTVLALSACGISGNLRNEPGYANFDSPGLLDTDREFALSLGPVALRFARKFVDDDPEVSAILDQLSAVRLSVYEIDANAENVSRRMGQAVDRLVEQGWMPLVAVREDKELVSVLVWMDDEDDVRGMAVIAQDASELVFVNLIGRIQPELFGTYMAELDITDPTTGNALSVFALP